MKKTYQDMACMPYSSVYKNYHRVGAPAVVVAAGGSVAARESRRDPASGAVD